MKKITIFSLTILLGSLCFYTACQKQIKTTGNGISTPAALTDADASIISTYAAVGTNHNAGMDFIYNDFVALKASMPQWKLTKNQVFNYYNQYACDYIDTLWNLTDSQYHMVLNSDQTFNGYFFFNNTPYTLSAVAQHCTATLSAALQNAVTQMIAIGDSAVSDSIKYALWDSLLYNNIGLIANYNEKAALAACITTAKASYQYWANSSNVSKWNALFGDITEAKTTADVGHWVSDALGALSGAVTYGAQGALFGPVGAIGAGVAGAVAGACSATATSVIGGLIASWFS